MESVKAASDVAIHILSAKQNTYTIRAMQLFLSEGEHLFADISHESSDLSTRLNDAQAWTKRLRAALPRLHTFALAT